MEPKNGGLAPFLVWFPSSRTPGSEGLICCADNKTLRLFGRKKMGNLGTGAKARRNLREIGSRPIENRAGNHRKREPVAKSVGKDIRADIDHVHLRAPVAHFQCEPPFVGLEKAKVVEGSQTPLRIDVGAFEDLLIPTSLGDEVVGTIGTRLPPTQPVQHELGTVATCDL
jgi:hypothetical protein